MARIRVKKGKGSPMVMHKGEGTRELQSRLKWLLDFLNMDTDSLNTVERLKLFLDLGVFIYGDPDVPFAERAWEQKFPDSKHDSIHERRFLKTCQDYLRWLLDRSKMDVKDLGGGARFPFPSISGMYEISYGFVVDKDKITKVPVYRPLSLPIPENLHKDGKIENFYRGLLNDAFATVLSPFLLSRIKTCEKPGCGKYFYQKTTKSKGDFCSRKCQNWANTNRWRQNHRPEYNAYHRNRRTKAKEPWVKITCVKCEYEYPKGHPDPGKCSRCGGKLRYEVMYFEDRKWKSEEYRNLKEAEELRKEILEFEKSEGRGTNGKR